MITRKRIKKLISVFLSAAVIWTVSASTAVLSFAEDTETNWDEWQKWYDSLSEEEKLTVNTVPPGSQPPVSQDDYTDGPGIEEVSPIENAVLKAIYNVKKFFSGLVNKAVKVNNGIASAQLSVEVTEDTALPADLSVRFNSERAGHDVKLYRYDEADKKLILSAKGKIANDGGCVFEDIKTGGDYLAVII